MADRSKSLSVTSVPVTVAMCAGKDCRKRCEFRKVRSALDAHVDVVDVKCVGLCKGPVVAVVDGDGHCETFAQLRTKGDRTSLVRMIRGDASSGQRLDDRRVLKPKVQRAMRRRLGLQPGKQSAA